VVTIKGLCQHQLGPRSNIRVVGCQVVADLAGGSGGG